MVTQIFVWICQGTVVLLFQPAEEAGNGAKRMMRDGALDNVEAIFALHVSHEHPTGVIGSRPGPLLAGCGFFRATIGGDKSRCIDPILAASAAVISLQGLVSREANPMDSQVTNSSSHHCIEIKVIKKYRGMNLFWCVVILWK